MDNKQDVKIESLNDYLNKFQLTDWPLLPDDIVLPNLEIESVFGSKDQIYNDLKSQLLSEKDPFNGIQYRVDKIEEILFHYKSYLLDDGKRFSKISNNMFYAPAKFFLTETELMHHEPSSFLLSDDDPNLSNELKRQKRAQFESSKKKRVDNVTYYGFDKNEFSELPNFLEAPHLHNLVTNSMSFKPSFLRFWTPIIRSEACNAILLDSFWWFYLHLYKKESVEYDKDKFLYFSRLSDSFVTLFMTVDSSLRDKFFNTYADFLARAVTLTFYRAFPDSIFQFKDSFKQEVCNIVNEWILGVRPVPETYLNWNLQFDVINKKQEKPTSNTELHQKISNLERLLRNLGNKEQPQEQVRSSRPMYLNKESRVSTNLRMGVSPVKIQFQSENKQESHVIGEGIVTEQVLFNLKGRSMLISHYLSIHNLKESETSGFKMQRTQIKSQPPKTAQTYRDVIFDTLKRSKSLEAEFKKISQQNLLDQKAHITKSRRRAIMSLSNESLTKNHVEMKQTEFEEQSSREFVTKETLQLNKNDSNSDKSHTESLII